MCDRIEKQIELLAPRSRVWRAITNHEEFGAWFGVKLDGPFAPGRVARGRMSHPQYEHITWEAVVQTLDPERLFSFTWHPYALDPETDYSQEPPTLVEFELEETPKGTLLRLTESGFDSIPPARRNKAYRSNDGGWTSQLKNIENYLAHRPQHASTQPA
ncbi:MAG TPA: SRPBCC family protein [Trueperaceae bacterium]